MDNKLKKTSKSSKTGMEIFYCILFWSVFVFTISLSMIYFCQNNTTVIKDFSLPLLALIFTIGQLWQSETKNRFDKERYFQSRKDLYFDKKVEIALAFNNYLEQLSSELSKPLFGQELLFDHQKFLFMQMNFYKSIVEKARFLFDESFMKNIEKVTGLTSNIQHEIQIMQNFLCISSANRNHPNFILAQQNYNRYYQELYDLTNEVCTYMVEQISIKETIND